MADTDFFEAARTCDLTWRSEPGVHSVRSRVMVRVRGRVRIRVRVLRLSTNQAVISYKVHVFSQPQLVPKRVAAGHGQLEAVQDA